MPDLTFIFLTVDDRIPYREIDPLSIDVQSQMEMAFESCRCKERFQDTNGNFTDYCTWEGITCDDLCVRELHFECEHSPLQGSVNLHFIPSTITSITFAHQELGGSLETYTPFPVM